MTGTRIDARSPRAWFAEAVARSVETCGARPSPEAVSYLVELLSERVRAPAASEGAESTLAESLLRARLERGGARLRRMRELGDRALFVAGFFGDSLSRSLVDLDYYGEIGRTAYADLAGCLERASADPTWPGLFEELAHRFRIFVDVLAEVGDRSRAHRPVDLLRLYERYLRNGSPRERDRLLRLGHVPPPRRGWGLPQ